MMVIRRDARDATVLSSVLLASLMVACSSSETASAPATKQVPENAPVLTAPPRKVPSPSASEVDASVAPTGATDTAACQPNAIGQFVYVAPNKGKAFYQSACTETEIDAFVAACLTAGAPAAACNTWVRQGSVCSECVVTSKTEKTGTGPFILDVNRLTPNVGGCLDQFGPACGGDFDAFQACAAYSCDGGLAGNCSGATTQQTQACAVAAATGGCRARFEAVLASCPSVVDPYGQNLSLPGQVCLEAQTEDLATYVKRISMLMCGPAKPAAANDAGPDAH